MARTPEQSDALIREIDDAVREDDMLSFWKHYGRLIAILVVVGLLAFGGWLFWQNYQKGQAELAGERFSIMLKAAQATRLDQTNYDQIMASADPGYRTEAQLVKAALAGGKDDQKGALAAYDAILADGKAPQPMKDLALVRRTALAFDTMKPDAVIAALKDLAAPGNPWFGSAGEMSAIAYLRMNKKREAGEMFASMSRDTQVPESLRLRAGQMAGVLGVAPAAIGSVSEEDSIADAQ